jgi:CubicO group peptidase (beta-lactamase class C family)
MKIQRLKYRVTPVILLLLIFTFSVFSQDAPLQGFDDYVKKAMEDWKVAGLAVAVVKDDKIVFAKGYGVREIGKPDPVTPNTVFAIGSSSKAFTAASVAMLVDEGKIKWTDPATKYLPGFQLYDPWVTRELSVTDLLSHRVGLERGDLMWYGSAYDRSEILRRIRFLRPSSSMRSRFGYQNIMYLAAGQIVPSVTGKSWDEFVGERIFTPLGMKSSTTSITKLSQMPEVATPHMVVEEKIKPIAWRNIDNIAPAGSINSNVTDMAQWVRMQLGSGKYDGKQIISEASIKNMWASHTIIPVDGQFGMFYPRAHFLNYGLGWFLSDFNGRKLVEHGGAIDGMRSAVAFLPEEKLGVVVLSNMNQTGLNLALASRIFDAYTGGKEKDWSGDMLKSIKTLEAAGKAAQQKMEADRVKDSKPSLDLARYTGDYQDEMYGDVKVTLENGKLKISYGAGFSGTMEHWHFDTFQVTWSQDVQGKGFANFKLNSQGKVDSVSLEGIAEFKRLPEKAPAAGK